MGISLADLENALETGLELASKLAPLASVGGPAAGAAGSLLGALAGWAATAVQEATSDEAIIAGGDVTKITALRDQLQAQNASLTAQIEAS